MEVVRERKPAERKSKGKETSKGKNRKEMERISKQRKGCWVERKGSQQ